ncbi:hypothetical protein Dimus_009187 [Dionaea muscipula]
MDICFADCTLQSIRRYEYLPSSSDFPFQNLHQIIMEIELGLKITNTIDDLVSTDFRLAKDRAGPLFISTETDSLFILNAHLKGFRRENIKISINEDGTRVTITGNKPVQEMVLTGRGMYKKEAEMRGFRKVFIIPEGVELNRIKAKFNEEESILTISMPKLNKGIRGTSVTEEINEELPASETGAEPSQQEDGSRENDTSQLKTEEADAASNRGDAAGIGLENETEEQENRQEKDASQGTVSEEKRMMKKLKLFSPCFFMGSALFASIVVLVVSLIRSKRR